MVAGLLPWMLIDGGVVVPEIVGAVGALICTDGVPERMPASWSPLRQTAVPSDLSTHSCWLAVIFFDVNDCAKLSTVAVRFCTSADNVCTASTSGAISPR